MDIVGYTEFLIKSIVKNPDMVKVERFDGDDNDAIIEIIVHSDDIGSLIGKNGKTAQAVRTIVQAYAFVNNMDKVKINIDSF